MTEKQVSRRSAILQLSAVAAVIAGFPRLARKADPIKMVVYKDPNCGCCEDWVTHMQDNGFELTVHDSKDMLGIRKKHLPNMKIASCHTGLVDDYVVEGHVPAGDVKKFLTEKPKGAIGLTIPGMPRSAPGMDLEPFVPYTVLTFDKKGVTTKYVEHTKK